MTSYFFLPLFSESKTDIALQPGDSATDIRREAVIILIRRGWYALGLIGLQTINNLICLVF